MLSHVNSILGGEPGNFPQNSFAVCDDWGVTSIRGRVIARLGGGSAGKQVSQGLHYIVTENESLRRMDPCGASRILTTSLLFRHTA